MTADDRKKEFQRRYSIANKDGIQRNSEIFGSTISLNDEDELS